MKSVSFSLHGPMCVYIYTYLFSSELLLLHQLLLLPLLRLAAKYSSCQFRHLILRACEAEDEFLFPIPFARAVCHEFHDADVKDIRHHHVTAINRIVYASQFNTEIDEYPPDVGVCVVIVLWPSSSSSNYFLLIHSPICGTRISRLKFVLRRTDI